MDFTPYVRGRFLRRLQDHRRYIDHADAVQQGALVELIENAALTEIGRKYEFSSIRTYREFAERLPLHEYADLEAQILRMTRGEKDVLWRGRCFNFAQSSGTSGARSKYIPITREAFARNHYRGASDAVSHYLNLNPDSRIFAGKGLILGGSFATELKRVGAGVRVGDLSASLIANVNPLVNLVRVPNKRIALMENWEEKLPALAEAARRANVTNLSGVPSWMLTVLKEVLRRAGATSLREVWPHLEVFFHGGIDFEPYRKQYEQLCEGCDMHYLNNYNASEGFFACQSDWGSTAMLLLLDIGVFYEFKELDGDERVLPIWEVEAGKTYELIITACNGLWRYRLGDTVTIEQTHPVKIRIAGRTKSFINAFGEELMVHNAEEAMTQACEATGARVADYTAAPRFAEGDRKACHQWVVEFDVAPTDTQAFAQALDAALRRVNSDYDAKRKGDIFLAAPELVVAPKGLFDRWLQTTGSGRLGGQRKVPRLRNDRTVMDQVLALLAK